MTMIFVPKEQLWDYVGKDLEPGAWFTVDQQRINGFAEDTEDRQFIHVDADAAARTPFGSTIAHGFLSLSLLTHLTSDCSLMPDKIQMALNYGFDKVRFINPVKVNSRIRAQVNIISVTEKDEGQLLLKQGISVQIEGEEKPALVAEWLVMYIV